MAGLERIDSIFDIDKIEAEYERLQKVADGAYAAIDKVFAATKQFKDANLGTLGSQTDDLTDKIKKSVVAQSELEKSKQRLAALSTEEAQKIAAVKIQIQQQTKANSDNAKETLGLVDAYGRLSKAYDDAQRKAKNLAITLGESNKQTVAAEAYAKKLGDRLKTADANVGQFGKNVGNYKSAFEGLSKGAEGFIEDLGELALGAFTVEKAFEFFKDSIAEFNKSEQAASKLKNTLTNAGRGDLFEPLIKESHELQETLGVFASNDIQESFQKLALSGKLTADQIKKLEPVIINFSANTGKSLSDSTDLFIRALSGQKRGLEGFGLQVSDSQTKAQNFAAIMRDVAPKIANSAKEYGDTLEGQQKRVDIAIEDLKVKIGSEFAPALKQGEAALLAFISNIPNLATKAADFFEDLTIKIKGVGAALLYLGTVGHVDLTKAVGDQATILKLKQDFDKQQEEDAARERQLDAAAAKIQSDKAFSLKDQISIQKDILKGQEEAYQNAVKTDPWQSKATLNLKKQAEFTSDLIKKLEEKPDTSIVNGTVDLELLKKINDEMAKLITLRHKLAIEIDNDSAGQKDSPFKIRTADAKEAFDLELQDRKDMLKNQLAAFGLDANQRKAIELDYEYDVYNIRKKYTALQFQILTEYKENEAQLLKDETDFFIDQAQKRLDAFQKVRDENAATSKASLEDEKNINLNVLGEQYAKGLISTRNYTLAKQKIEDQAAKDSIASQLKVLQDERSKLPTDIEQATPEQRQKIAENNAAQAGLKNQGVNVDVNAEDREKAKVLRIKQAIGELSKQFIDLGQSLVDAQYQKELDALQKLTDANTKLKDAELDRINQSTLSEQDKAAKVTLLNAQYQAQQDAIDLQARKIKHDQAVADKAFNVAKTIEEGIVATVTAFAEGGPVLAAIVGAASAVLLAKIIATPIPAYEGGTGAAGHPGGLMKTHTGELRINPDGSSAMTPDGETMSWGAKGTKIIPRHEVDRLRRLSVSQMHVDQHGILRALPREENEAAVLERAIKNQTLELSKVLRKQKGTTINNRIDMDNITYLNKKVFK